MKRMTDMTVDHPLFSGEVVGEIGVLTFKSLPLLQVTDLEAKEALFEYLDLISKNDEIRALLIKSAPAKMCRSEYIRFYQKMIASDDDRLSFERMYNALNQFILKLADFNKMVIHADCGNVILLFLNVSLACDYRIIADNTVYQNPNIELGVVPKGGSVFFLSKMLGPNGASRMLLSGEDVPADQALQLGIVDNVVSLDELDQVALAAAQRYARLPSGYSVGIKKLLNFDIRDLKHYLEFEDDLLRKRIQFCKSHNVYEPK